MSGVGWHSSLLLTRLWHQAAEEEAKAEALQIESLKGALNGAAPCVVSFALLSAWSNGFSPDQKIGGGAFGDVYHVVCKGLPRLAVKRLHEHVRLQGTDEDRQAALRCFSREIKVLGAFHHPNIIKLLGFTGFGDQAAVLAGRVELCLVYELAPRGGLDDNLRSDGKAAELTWKIRIRVAAGIAKALAYLHSHDPNGPVFHRDVKSANCALLADLTPKLIDCGLAKYVPTVPGVGTVMTATGMRMGTPGYQCPTYVVTGTYDPRSEIFSLGIVFLELLVGKLQSNAAEFNIYETYIEDADDHDVLDGLDIRAGVWDKPCVDEFVALTRECLSKYRKRITTMAPVVRRLVDLQSRFCKKTHEEDLMVKEITALRAQLEAIQTQQTVDQRAVLELTCKYCFLDFKSDQGTVCPDQPDHFLCAVCFDQEVLSQVSPDFRALFAANEARVICRMCTPAKKTLLSEGCVARGLNDTTFAHFHKAAGEVVESRIYQEQERLFLERLEAQRQAMLAQTDFERHIGTHRLHIIEHILCLHCPRCQQAFVDFDGCFALTCSRCKCGFCGYCLRDCENDAHRHVANCPFNIAPGRDVFASRQIFDRAQNERRGRLLREYLRKNVPDAHERQAVKAAIQRDLGDLNLKIEHIE